MNGRMKSTLILTAAAAVFAAFASGSPCRAQTYCNDVAGTTPNGCLRHPVPGQNYGYCSSAYQEVEDCYLPPPNDDQDCDWEGYYFKDKDGSPVQHWTGGSPPPSFRWGRCAKRYYYATAACDNMGGAGVRSVRKGSGLRHARVLRHHYGGVTASILHQSLVR